jgi:hypothetical protein
MRERPARVQGLEEGEAPSCYLSSIELPGSPELVIRQFTTPDGNTSATGAYEAIKSKTKKCPAKNRTKSRKLPNNRVTLAHDDTWKVTEDQLSGWRHIRGIEKNVYPPSTSIINVYHIYFDYAVRGNVVIASVYWQRTKPSQSSEPIEKKATEVLTKQLQKIG